MLQTKSSTILYKCLSQFIKPIGIANVEYPVFQLQRGYAKKPALTAEQIEAQKLRRESNLKSKSSIKGTPFTFNSVETSIQYMKSEAFDKAYGTKLIWEWYIRNFRGGQPKTYTRKECIVMETYATGNPCPVCRDPYLVVDYKNVDLLNQFVSPYTGYLYPASKTSVCKKQHENLEVAFRKACDHGLIEHNIPHRTYDYSKYFSIEEIENIKDLQINIGTSLKKEIQATQEKPSVLLGVVLGANRKNINDIYNNLEEEDIVSN